jgi:hypothetical protein
MNRMNRRTFSIAEFGTRVGTRSEGEAARERLLAALSGLPSDGQLVVSLDGVEVLSGSFADEVIAKTYQLLLSGAYEERTMVVGASSKELTEGLEDKLRQRQLAMLCVDGNAWRVLGQLAEPHVETLALLIDRETASAKELADTLGIQPNACHQRLKRLVDLRLILQERIGVNAPQTQYRFCSIL